MRAERSGEVGKVFEMYEIGAWFGNGTWAALVDAKSERLGKRKFAGG